MADITRRRTVLAAGAAALASSALTGCSSGEERKGPDASTGSGTGGDTSPGGGGVELATVADIPVGGGKVFKDAEIVVTQPTAGEFKAFSAVCTHQGCTVSSISDGNIVCPCHQSLFKVSDGSVAGGPATRSLPLAKITVVDGKITLG
ncbi:Rieske (2Fe-2S) protein [Streptomyces sp. NPDC058583]|uniref:Rieske (2Fe-2S) protein n=1 Tax=unclassified Streptomyces TaxID=2593676 RepID=UPI003668028B